MTVGSPSAGDGLRRGIPFASRDVRLAGRLAVGAACRRHGHSNVVIVALFVLGSLRERRGTVISASLDPSQVVIDEVVGMLITLFLNPVGWAGGRWRDSLDSRVADVVKPYPSNRARAAPRRHGVMADDAMAAGDANLALRAASGSLLGSCFEPMRACVIAVGSELLTPVRVDSNSLFITERLNEIGVDVRLKVVVGRE